MSSSAPQSRQHAPEAILVQTGEVCAESRLHSLTIVLGHLWSFYQAMRQGKPLADADEMLTQIGTALRQVVKVRHSRIRPQRAEISATTPLSD
jgi:hypothetical protein